MVMPKQVAKMFMGTALPHLEEEGEHKEDWDGNMQKEWPRMCPQNTRHPQSQNIQHP